MKIACLDFETANSSRASICSIGVAIFQDGVLTSCQEKLIKPHFSCSDFFYMNIKVHGITASDVECSPEFDEVAPWLFELLNADLVVAHNASFDISVLRAACELYGIDCPEFNFLCTMRSAKKFWPDFENHKLNNLCDYLGHKFLHHNAAEDAQAAGLVLLRMLEESNCSCAYEFLDKLKLSMGKLTPHSYSPCGVKK